MSRAVAGLLLLLLAPAAALAGGESPALPADVILKGVTFATNSANLTESSKPILDDVAKDLREHPHLVVEVQGHTDSTGEPGYNLTMSQRRAEAVREYLISQGVAAGQLTAKGYGQTQPIASNSTRAARAQNRRVVIHVLQNPADDLAHQDGVQQEEPARP